MKREKEIFKVYSGGREQNGLAVDWIWQGEGTRNVTTNPDKCMRNHLVDGVTVPEWG